MEPLVLPPFSAHGETEAQRGDRPPRPVPPSHQGLSKHGLICSEMFPLPAKGVARLRIEGLPFPNPITSASLDQAAHGCSVLRV